ERRAEPLVGTLMPVEQFNHTGIKRMGWKPLHVSVVVKSRIETTALRSKPVGQRRAETLRTKVEKGRGGNDAHTFQRQALDIVEIVPVERHVVVTTDPASGFVQQQRIIVQHQ